MNVAAQFFVFLSVFIRVHLWLNLRLSSRLRASTVSLSRYCEFDPAAGFVYIANMMWKGALVLLGCGLATAVCAEDPPAQTPPAPSLDLPALEQPGKNKNTLPEKISLPGGYDAMLPDAVPSRPRTTSTGTAKDKNWLVNGLSAWQKKQTEEQNILKQKQQEAGEQWYQQELGRRQKQLTGAITVNPLDNSKLTLTGSNPDAAAPAEFSRQLSNLPAGRLSLSGSNSSQNITVNLSGLPEFTSANGTPSRDADTAAGPASSSYHSPQPYNNPLPGLGGQRQWSGSNSAAWQKNAPAAGGPLPHPPPQSPAVRALPQAPTLSVNATPYPPAASQAQNGNPFTSAQAANLLKQLDSSKNNPANPNRPNIKDLHNGIPNPADMRRF